MKKTNEKNIVSAKELLIQARAYAKGGEKPSWLGGRVYAGPKAVEDWDQIASEPISIGQLSSFGRLIEDNHDLIEALSLNSFGSIAALSKSIGRAESNVSRTLNKLVEFGFVDLIGEEGSRAKRPVLALRKVRMDVDILEMTVSMKKRQHASA